MGREIKRVALDFEWPIDKVWKGYINPHYDVYSEKCSECDYGCSKEYIAQQNKWYGYTSFKPEENGSKPWSPTDPRIVEIIGRKVDRDLDSWRNYAVEHARLTAYDGEIDRDFIVYVEAVRMCAIYNKAWQYHLNQEDVQILVDAGRLMDFTRRPVNEEQHKKLEETGGHWMKEYNGYTPSPDEVNLWAMQGIGHCSTNAYTIIKTYLDREGLPSQCSNCDDGLIWDKEGKKLYDEWEDYDPPEGPGYQLWTTTNEGAPMTPVFKTPEELARYCVDHGVSSFGYQTEKYDTWLKWAKNTGWAPTAVMENGEIKSGVKAVGDK